MDLSRGRPRKSPLRSEGPARKAEPEMLAQTEQSTAQQDRFRSFRVQFRQAHDLKAVGSNPAQESKNTSFSIYISLSCGRLYQILRLAIAAFVAAFENRANQARVPSGQIIQDKNTPGGRNGHRLPQEQPHMLDRQWQKQAIRFDRQTMMSFEWCSLRSTSSACPRS